MQTGPQPGTALAITPWPKNRAAATLRSARGGVRFASPFPPVLAEWSRLPLNKSADAARRRDGQTEREQRVRAVANAKPASSDGSLNFACTGASTLPKS